MVKSIALQIVGQLREGWEEIHNQWLSVKDNAPADMDIDFFLSSWECDEYKEPSSLFIKSHLEDQNKFKYDVGILYYYNRMKKASLLRKEYEIESNKKYDFVVQLRPDAYMGNFWRWIEILNNRINSDFHTSYLNNHKLISYNTIATHKGRHNTQEQFYFFVDDKFFAGAPGAIDYLNSVGDEVVRSSKYQLNYHVSLAEYLLDGRMIVERDVKIKFGLQRDFNNFQDFLDGKNKYSLLQKQLQKDESNIRI